MPATDSAAVIVARFLKANHYTSTFDAFIAEAGLQDSDGDTRVGDWTIEKILEEKRQFDTSLAFERAGDGGSRGWSQPAPSLPQEPAELHANTNILCVNASESDESSNLIVTGADRRWHELSSSPPFQKISTGPAQDSPILCVKHITPGGLRVSTSMAGELMLGRRDLSVIDKRRDHTKYAVQVVAEQLGSDLLVATAGWDQKVHLYTPSSSSLGEPIHTILLPSNPESLVLVRHPDTDVLHLVLSRRDSSHLFYYSIHRDEASRFVVKEAGRQNLAPHSNAWVAFTPSCLAKCPTDPTLLAIATSHLPHMKLILVRLLFPGVSEIRSSSMPQTQASQARLELAVQDREDAAITMQITTMAPQTPYSTPQVVWRPDGSGVWVNGDDGVVRGVNTQNGKVVATLKAHEPGTKVRTLWAGRVPRSRGSSDGEAVEILVSGGFDKKVFVWTVADKDDHS